MRKHIGKDHKTSQTEHKEAGRPNATPEITAEQTRETREAEAARAASPTIRERMVDIGRGRQQSGRQGQ